MRCLSKNLVIPLAGALLLTAVCPCPAQELDFGGYFKSLFIAGNTFFEEGYYLVLHRLRTEFTFYPTHSVEFFTALDNQVRWGSYLDTVEYSYARPLDDQHYVDMALDPLDNSTVHWRADVYRMYLRTTGRRADFVVGRQRIAWGTGRLWNPTDLFNPTSPLQIEPGEKRGADAVYAALRPIDGLQIELAGAIGSDEDDRRWGARAGTAVGSYDMSAMAGRFRDSTVAGFDFSGYLGGAGFRGEFSHTWAPGGDRYWRAVLSFENAFRGGLIFMAEYLYNGGNIGEITPEVIENLASFDAITTINRHFMAIQLTRELTPLIYGSLLAIFEAEENGFFLFPSISYSWKQDIDVIVGAQLFLAEAGDFALGHNALVVSMEWYF